MFGIRVENAVVLVSTLVEKKVVEEGGDGRRKILISVLLNLHFNFN